jgi:hypothetical protein
MFNYKKYNGGAIQRTIISAEPTKVDKKLGKKTIKMGIKELILLLAVSYGVIPEVILLAMEFLGVPLGYAIGGELGNFFAAFGMFAGEVGPRQRQNLIRQAMNVVNRIRGNPRVLRTVLAVAENLGNAYNAIHDRYYFRNQMDIPADVHIPDVANLLAMMGPPAGDAPADVAHIGLPPAYMP